MFALAATAAVLGAMLLFLATRWVINRWVEAGEKVDALADLSEPQPSDWHMHLDCPGRDKCVCEGTVIHPCRHHKGQAAAVLHQETK